MGQQFYFFIDPTGIACQTSVSPDDTMARNDDGNGIVPHCAADRLGGHVGDLSYLRHSAGDLAISHGLSIGNLQ